MRAKYGERSVSHIITFGTMGAKSVVRDVGRVLGWSYGDADRLAKMIPTELNMTLAKAREMNPELETAIENDPRTQELWRHASFLEGLTRNAGIHAAGIVIGDQPLDTFVPLTRGNAEEVVTQYRHGAAHRAGHAQDGLPRPEDADRHQGRRGLRAPARARISTSRRCRSMTRRPTTC